MIYDSKARSGVAENNRTLPSEFISVSEDWNKLLKPSVPIQCSDATECSKSLGSIRMMLFPVMDGRFDFSHGNPMATRFGSAGKECVRIDLSFFNSNQQILLRDRSDPLPAMKEALLHKVPISGHAVLPGLQLGWMKGVQPCTSDSVPGQADCPVLSQIVWVGIKKKVSFFGNTLVDCGSSDWIPHPLQAAVFEKAQKNEC